MKVYTINKRVGETPLEALRKLVKRQGLPAHDKYTYAGRLDPLAEGVLLVLANATQKQKEKYLNLPKVYEAEILFGLGTDSGDLLGLPKKGSAKIIKHQDVTSVAIKLVPFISLPIPAFSSVIVKGRPAFNFARAGKKIKMPVREMKIKSINIQSVKIVTAKTVLARAKKRISLVQGDFRQDRILKSWSKLLNKPKTHFQVAKIKIHCASGTYVRSIAHYLGETLGTNALLYSLKRTAVAKYLL